VARALAGRLAGTGWITDASVTGGGYLTVTVTPAALENLAVRVPAAGAACAASDALEGTEVPAPPEIDPATWDEAWQLVAAQTTARLARAAGATPADADEWKFGAVLSTPKFHSSAFGAAEEGEAGGEAVRYALTRVPRHRAGRGIDAARYVQNNFASPYFTVRYAHAYAASVRRWAADLGLERGPAEAFRPGYLRQARELEVLGLISFMPERGAGAARRRRPDVFARYLEGLAAVWLSCREECPALPFGGRSAPREEPGIAARLWLAAAVQTALETGLGLLGVAGPERL
jgi:hypothetical protein